MANGVGRCGALLLLCASALSVEAGTLRGTVQLNGQQLIPGGFVSALNGDDRSGVGLLSGSTYQVSLSAAGMYRPYVEVNLGNGSFRTTVAISRGASSQVPAVGETFVPLSYRTNRINGNIQLADGANPNGATVQAYELTVLAWDQPSGDRFTTRVYSTSAGNSFSFPVIAGPNGASATGTYQLIWGRATVVRHRDGARFTIPIGAVTVYADLAADPNYWYYQNYGTQQSPYWVYAPGDNTTINTTLSANVTNLDATRGSMSGQISVGTAAGDQVTSTQASACDYYGYPYACASSYSYQNGPYALSNLRSASTYQHWASVGFKAPYGSYRFPFEYTSIVAGTDSVHDHIADAGFATGTFKVQGMAGHAYVQRSVYGSGMRGDSVYGGVSGDKVGLAGAPGTYSLNSYAYVYEYPPTGGYTYSQLGAPAFATTLDPTTSQQLPEVLIETTRFRLIIDSAAWGGSMPNQAYLSAYQGGSLYASSYAGAASRVGMTAHARPGTYTVYGGAYPGPRYCYESGGATYCYDSYGYAYGTLVIEAPVQTDLGTGVTVANTNATVTFGTVTGAGLTAATNVFTGPLPPSGKDLVKTNDSNAYWSVETTAAYSGGVTLCFAYRAATSVAADQEAQITLVEWTGSAWRDITTDLDTVANQVCGSTTTTGYFAVVMPADGDNDGIPTASDNCPSVANADQLDTDLDHTGDGCDDDDDGDGHADGSDNCSLLANSDQANLDGDAHGDACDDDIDGDGDLNTNDNCWTTSNADQQDLDGDGLGDACDTDVDGDGDLEGADNCPTTKNADQADLDGDGAGDVCDADDDSDGDVDDEDNCPITPNSDQADLDSDGLGDACDSDRDDDGTVNATDNCPDFASADQTDTDTDGSGDACDVDDDGDGVRDADDNCRQTSNGNQADADLDGQGDACDGDVDGDSVVNAQDNCPSDANLDQLDTDIDHTGDACDTDDDNDGRADDSDNCVTVANVGQLDTDGDVIGDACDADDDNDGALDGKDNCALLSNADQTNTDADSEGDACDVDDDNDGVYDGQDNCALVANTNQANLDRDTVGDACDPDDDNDDVLDGNDNCASVENRDQANLDGDAAGDACDPDDDNDNVADGDDNCAQLANSDQANNDGDSAGDACDPDDDNDASLDGIDNCPFISNADQVDADLDALGNACDADDDDDSVVDTADNCQLTPNADQRDGNSDGEGDACDDDRDGDGVLNSDDNCVDVANADQGDFDADTTGDACDPDLDGDGRDNDRDNCPLVANDTQDDNDGDSAGDVCDPDDDNDNVSDGGDNCPLLANSDQVDTDRDWFGDACDVDDDNDDVVDGPDNCPLIANTDQGDHEQDGIGDVCDPDDDNDSVLDGADNCALAKNTDQADFDQDGTGNACDLDVDNDGVTNGSDVCAFTPVGSIVETSTGCSLAQLCPCATPRGQSVPWKNHGAYVSCVAQASNSFVTQNLFTSDQKSAAQSAAASSTCGNK